MQVMENRMSKVVLILVVAAGLLFLVKTNEKKMGEDVSMIVMLLVVLAALYGLFVVNQETQESFYQGETNSVATSDTESVPDVPSVNNQAPPEVAPGVPPAAPEAQEAASGPSNNAPAAESAPAASEPLGQNELNSSVENMFRTPQNMPSDCYPRDVLSSSDLLPRDTSSTWAQSVPANQGGLTDQNFLNAGYHNGVNTVGQTLRNANRQLRSDPPCPRTRVSPWLQTTIEPDTNRQAFEIGGN